MRWVVSWVLIQDGLEYRPAARITSNMLVPYSQDSCKNQVLQIYTKIMLVGSSLDVYVCMCMYM